jgi:excisionase family DNA binding protein
MRTQLDRLAISTREAAAILGISPRIVKKYIATKVLPARKIARRTVIPFCALEEFLRKDQPSPFVDQSIADRD